MERLDFLFQEKIRNLRKFICDKILSDTVLTALKFWYGETADKKRGMFRAKKPRLFMVY